MVIHKAYRFRLRPSKAQESHFRQFAGCRRFAWNKALGIQENRVRAGERSLSYNRMAATLPAWKQEHPFLAEPPSQALQQVLMDLDRAIREAFDKKNPKRFPVFKKKGKSVDSFRLPQGFRVEQGNGRIFLPKVGWVRYRNSRRIEGKQKQVTVSRSHDGWYVSVQVEINTSEASIHPSSSSVGIDRGVDQFAAFSDGTILEPGNPLKNRLGRLARLQRKLGRKDKFSNNWKKQKEKIGKLLGRVADARRDFLHKASTTICKNHAIVVMEDLRIGNMTRSAKGTIETPGKKVRQKSGLNRAILDQGWGEFQRQVGYKLEWAGGELILVNPAYTSQECSACHHLARENRKTRDKFECVACGHAEDADVNAAKNIKAAGLAVSACGGFSASRPPMKQEPPCGKERCHAA
jgi:putative transposase